MRDRVCLIRMQYKKYSLDYPLITTISIIILLAMGSVANFSMCGIQRQ